MLDEDAIAALQGATIIAAGQELGEVQEVFTHSWDDRPALVAVTTEGGSVLVPLPDADVDVSETRVQVPYDEATITGAPAPSGDALTQEDFEAVYDHYGISDADMREDSGAFREESMGGGDPRAQDAADDSAQGHP